jgi:nucleoside phosphorylase
MVCVFSALKRETDPFLDRLECMKKVRLSLPAYEGRLSGREVRVVRTGIGLKALDPLLLEGCELLVSAGWCGGLAPEIRTADVVVATAVFPGTGETGEVGLLGLPSAPVPVEAAVLLDSEQLRTIQNRTGVRIHLGPTVTSDRVVHTPADKARLHLSTSALSVDMEDRLRMEFAKRCGVPFVSLRAVLDELGDHVPGRSSKSPGSISPIKDLVPGGPAPRGPGPRMISAIRACGVYASLLAKSGPASRNLAAVIAAFIESSAPPADTGAQENQER